MHRIIAFLFFFGLYFIQAFGQVIPEVAVNQCISLDKPVYCSNTALNWSSPISLSDGDDGTVLEVASPVALALQVDAQTSTADSLILHWRAQSWENRDSTLASLKHYEIYTSDNSTDGVNGDWTFVQEGFNSYKDNFVFFPNNQPKWVKVVELESDTLKLARLEVFQNAPAGKENDIWLFFGDSETLGAMGAGSTNYQAATRFGNQIHADNPCYYPMIINGGKGGETTTEAEGVLNEILDDMPQISIVAYCYGLNDVMNSNLLPYDDPINDISTEVFLDSYKGIMDICNARGVLPIPSRIPWIHFPNEYYSYADTTEDKTNGVTPFNLYEIDTIIKQYAPYAIDTTTGIPYADFETWLREHRDDSLVFQEDYVHLYEYGINEFNKIWVNTAQKIVYTNTVCDTTGMLTLTCPENIYVTLSDSVTEATITWDSPLATTECGMGNSVLLTQVSGPSYKTALTVGNYYVTYDASNNCDQIATCRFSISIQPAKVPFDCGEIDGYVKVGELDNHGYYLSENINSWFVARDSANALGGHLATISSQAENDLLQAALNQETAYIGFYDYLKEGSPEWANGEPLTMNLESENSDENDFAAINFWAGTWTMANQWVQQKYIMEQVCEVFDLNMTCTDDITIVLPIGQIDTAYLWEAPSAMTICDTSADVILKQVSGLAPGASLAYGIYDYTWAAVDSCGNVDSCSFSITVDTTVIGGDLSLTCPSDVDVTLAFGQVDTVWFWDAPALETTCNWSADVSLTQIAGPLSGTEIGVGNHIVTYAAADSCGNADTCSLSITVDTIPLMGTISLSCPDDIQVEVPIGQMDTVLTWASPDYSTTCNVGLEMVLIQTQGPDSGSAIQIGEHTVSYSVTDNCNNVDSCHFAISVTIAPDGVNNFISKKPLVVYPSPVNRQLHIDMMPFSGKDVEINIYSLSGALVYSQKEAVTKSELVIDVSSIEVGMYFIQVSGDQEVSWARFVKI